MTQLELEAYFASLGWQLEHIIGRDQKSYLVIRGYEIPTGRLKGRKADIAIAKVTGVPYVPPAAIHTKPHLVPMDMQSYLRTQTSGIGDEWQYWSRLLRRELTPKAFVVHLATIFSEVQ